MTDTQIEQALQPIADATDLDIQSILEIHERLTRRNIFTEEALLSEIKSFYQDLGLPRHYFSHTPNELIASHIESFMAARVLANIGGERIRVHHEAERKGVAIHACEDVHETAVRVERRIERKFPCHRVQSYRSENASDSSDSNSQLRLYFVSAPTFDETPVDRNETDISRIGAREMLTRAIPATRERYQRIITELDDKLGLVIHTHKRPEFGTIQLLLAFRGGRTHSFFSAISDVLNAYGVKSRRKFIEQFKNGLVIYSVHIDATTPPDVVAQIHEDLSLVYVLPRTGLTPLLQQASLSAQQITYAYAAWKFAHQFLSRYSREYQLLAPAFANDPVRLGLLARIKHRLNKDTFTEARIYDCIVSNIELVKELFDDFARLHFRSNAHQPDSFDREHGAALESRITQAATSEIDTIILLSFLTFNRHILKTNFYRDSKTAIAFRLDPSFLPSDGYPCPPHAVYFCLGSEFRGFHVRFRDVARGGIRVIRSPDAAQFGRNRDTLFDEAYQLARTQQSKNKDIPEGGSKGVLLLSLEHQDKTRIAFKKFVDSLLDLLLPNEEIADHLGQEEIVFLGPDEGTAELMDWAAEHARIRGYPFWRAFTTGKSLELGGIPHDRYGMTTRSVHQYVLGILGKLGIDETAITKFQTGGPDGDLGSNEILISRDRTVAIIDGSGVAFDPNSLNRDELTRLANERLTIVNYDRSLLSDRGFLVTTEDRNIRLPDGTLIENGLLFRNAFHLNRLASADLFVPCGGRPESVHINNVDALLDSNGKARIRFVVEGANLFFTQPARRHLEQAGVVLIKDASANKGGVISSSLEVLSALAMDATEFGNHMEVHDETPPEFYQRYTAEVQQRIEETARLEFECIWREHERTDTPRCDITDRIGEKINRINDDILTTQLADDTTLQQIVVTQAAPPALIELLGAEAIVTRLPKTYLHAWISSYLASRYVYRYGLDASEINFLTFIKQYR